MSRRRSPLFLARRSYRRRRLRDAARLLPVFGAFLFLLPILWEPAATDQRDTAPDGVYLFAVWAVLIPRGRRHVPGPQGRGAGGWGRGGRSAGGRGGLMPFDLLVLSCLCYVILLFLVAFLVERRAVGEALPWLRSPLVYTLSLSIYCTAWTFYGAVGYAARSGLEYLTIYLGPTLVFVGWWWVLRKLVRIGRQQRVTSIADLISLALRQIEPARRARHAALRGGRHTLYRAPAPVRHAELQRLRQRLARGLADARP